MDQDLQNKLKKEAGIKAAQLVKDGMVAGLGTGSTVRYLVDELGRRVQEEGLKFTGVTTSRRTAKQAEGYGIKIVNIDDVDHIDLTIDGADQVDKNFNGIKGGGAALLWEKIVAINSRHYVWIVDQSKLADTIGSFPLPVEVIPFGAGHVISRFKDKGYNPVLRLGADGQPIRTDENDYIVDLHLNRIDHPKELGEDLINTVGVVEHGLFLNMVDEVIVGNEGAPKILKNPYKGGAIRE
jgi:ribose 5-phosphate isomerase A